MAPIKIALGINKQDAKKPPSQVQSQAKFAFGGDSDDEQNEQPVSNVSEQGAVEEITTFDDQHDLVEKSTVSSKGLKPRLGPSVGGRAPKRPFLKTENQASLSSLRDRAAVTQEAQSVDSSIYDYDAYHASSSSAMAASKRAAAKADAAARVPKYMAGMHTAAETRKRDQLMAQDKLLQREREKEGEEFGDKEKFVTASYKQQQEEVRRAEEEEKRREEQEMKGREGQGMSAFYHRLMEEEEQRHRQKVEAGNLAQEEGHDLQHDEPQDQEQEAADMARKLKAEGVDVALNEEGQVTDKRQLLKAGLNVASRSKAAKYTPTSQARDIEQRQSQRGQQSEFDAGHSDARRATRERQTRMIAAQIEAQAKRRAEEDAEQLQKRHQAAKSTKSEGDIANARERYFERKREAAAAEAADLQ